MVVGTCFRILFSSKNIILITTQLFLFPSLNLRMTRQFRFPFGEIPRDVIPRFSRKGREVPWRTEDHFIFHLVRCWRTVKNQNGEWRNENRKHLDLVHVANLLTCLLCSERSLVRPIHVELDPNWFTYHVFSIAVFFMSFPSLKISASEE